MATEAEPVQDSQNAGVVAPQVTRRQLELGIWVAVPLCAVGGLIWQWQNLAGSLVPLPTDDTAGAAWRVTIVWLRWNLIALYGLCAAPGYVFFLQGPGSARGGRQVLTGIAIVAGLGTSGLWTWGLPGASNGLYVLLVLLALWPALLALRILFDRETEDEVEPAGPGAVSSKESTGPGGPPVTGS